jgi:N,N-dimethylformamidase
MVFFETPAGGAVFAVGSIAWFGALARDGYDNDVARITTNVLRRFADPEPFPPPASGSSGWSPNRPPDARVGRT